MSAFIEKLIDYYWSFKCRNWTASDFENHINSLLEDNSNG